MTQEPIEDPDQEAEAPADQEPKVPVDEEVKAFVFPAGSADPDDEADLPDFIRSGGSVQQRRADGAPSEADESDWPELSEFTATRGLSKKLSMTHVFLIANTVAVVALVVSVVFLPLRSPVVVDYANTVSDTTTQDGDASAEVTSVATEKSETEVVSWERARTAFARKEYASALQNYGVLYRIALNSPEPDLVADLFKLRMAQCLEQLAKPSEAQKSFEMATASRSPVIRGVANYYMAMSAKRKGQSLRARRKAYLATAALAGLTDRLPLETNCAFLIARTLTDSALSFYGKGELVSWPSLGQSDPFAGLDEGGLRKLLTDGVKESGQAVLAPQVQLADRQDHTNRWTATCLRTPLAELLSLFATRAQTDLRWVSISPAVSNRPMSLQVRRVSGQRLCELAAGSVGLIVRFTGDAIDVYDPAGCESLNQQRGLLVSEAMVIWRRLFLRAPHDERIADGHFALALLQECSGDVIGAIAEYGATARNFRNARVAPRALLQSAKLRIELRDYSGARKDLLGLLDTYPDSSKSAEAYASLGEATMKAGNPAEAFRVFKKLFFLGQSAELKLSACLGAGKCLYRRGKYDAAVKWLNDHITMAADGGKGNLSQAYLLLGQCHSVLGNTRQAVVACQLALAMKLDADERIEAYLTLAGAWRNLGEMSRALAASLHLVKETESGVRKHEALLMAAGIYREIGLAERGAAFLSLHILKTLDPEIRAKLRIEQARCYRDAERFSEAYDILTEAPEMLSPGREAQEAACDLAEVCLRIGRPGQAAVVADRVLKSTPAGLHRKRARELLATAYMAKKEYENAAVTLSDMPISQLGGKQQ